MSEGLLIIRLVIGGLMFAHGTQKLFGWYGGYGLDGTGGFFASLGFRPGRQMAMVAGLSEAVGGAFLVLGLMTPLGAAMILGTMIAAATSVHAPHGLWSTNGGYELPLINAVVAAGLAFTGAGSASIDHAAGIPWTSGAGPGCTAILLAVFAFGATNLRRKRVLQETAEPAYPADETVASETTASARH